MTENSVDGIQNIYSFMLSWYPESPSEVFKAAPPAGRGVEHEHPEVMEFLSQNLGD